MHGTTDSTFLYAHHAFVVNIEDLASSSDVVVYGAL